MKTIIIEGKLDSDQLRKLNNELNGNMEFIMPTHEQKNKLVKFLDEIGVTHQNLSINDVEGRINIMNLLKDKFGFNFIDITHPQKIDENSNVGVFQGYNSKNNKLINVTIEEIEND